MKKDTLFNKDFTLLWLGQTVSEIGNGAGYIALLWWVTVETGSVIALGTLAMIKGIVAVATGPFAGALVDRLNRKNIIVITDFLQGVIFAVLAYLAFSSRLTMPVIYLSGALSTLIAQLFMPAIGASLPLIVPANHLSQANSLRQMSSSIVKIIGYAAGGIGVAYFGIPMLFLINSVSFMVSSFSELFIDIPKVIKSTKLPTLKDVTADIKIGFLYIKESKALAELMSLVMIINVILVPFFLLLPKFVEEVMSLGSDVYGFILSGQMIGSLLGAALMSAISIPKKYPKLIKWCLFLTGLSLLPLPFLPTQYWQLHVIIFVVSGILSVIFNINAITLLQRKIPQEHLGKIFGFIGTLSNGLTPAAQGLTGVIANFIAIPIIYLFCSIGAAIAGIKFALSKAMVSWVLDSTPADSTGV